MSKQSVEYAFDLHSGLHALSIPEFDDLSLIGMAATLAIHLKGLGDVEFDVLRKVSDHYMGIPSLALREVLQILEEVDFIDIYASGRNIQRITPKIPVFGSVYEGLGEFVDASMTFNEHEQAIVGILDHLSKSAFNRDSLEHSLGLDRTVYDRTIMFGERSGLVREHLARGKKILVSPAYFTDNLQGLADAAASAGAPAIQSVLNKVRNNQGWPLSLTRTRAEIGHTKISATEASVLEKLAREGVVRPPTILFGGKTESFLFTPKPGASRLNAANREIYERAMALISAVRKGQLLPEEYSIRSPVSILRALRDRGYLGANSEAREQYANLVVLRVATLRQVTLTKYQLRLNRTPENDAALDLAIDMLMTGEIAGMEVDKEARLALTKDEKYIQSIISASKLRERDDQLMTPEAEEQFQQLLLKLD